MRLSVTVSVSLRRGYATAFVLLRLLVCHRLPLVVGHPLSLPRIVPDTEPEDL